MSLEVSLLLLRLALIAVLYLFLLLILLFLWRDLRRAGRRAAPPGWGQLAVAESRAANLIAGQVMPLEPGDYRLGRGPENRLVFEDEFVSAHHARLFYRDGRWWLEDLGSTNGTIADGRLVDRPLALHWGSVIQVGTTTLRLERGPA